MAFYIELIKLQSGEDFIYYTYEFSIVAEFIKNKAGKLRGKSKIVKGKIRINTQSGNVEVVQLAEGDNGMYAQRAALALIKHWKQGEFPDKTCWAS